MKFTREQLIKKGFLWKEDSYLEYVFDMDNYMSSGYLVTSDDDGKDQYEVYLNNKGECLSELKIDVIMSKQKELVEFGNFMLSEERNKSILNKEIEDCVRHSDLENFKELKNRKKDEK